jgi:enoyl-CoA hydratase
MTTFSTLRYSTDGDGVATVALDQPDNRNALSDQLMQDMLDALETAKADAAVRCVVLTSTHERVFSAGGNLAGFVDDSPLAAKHLSNERFPRLLLAFGRLGKPSICAANGHVLAGALGVALACDLVIAKAGVRFGTPEVNIGAFPYMIMALIYRNVPRKKATELLLLGDQIDAAEAERLGIVNKVVAPEEFDAAVADWARRLAARSPLIMRLGKDAMERQQDMSLPDALDFLRAQLTLTWSTNDLHEGVSAFFDKRAPTWSGT